MYFERVSLPAILRVILLNFRKRKCRSTGNLYLNNHWNPTLSISQKKVIVMSNIMYDQNDRYVPAVIKLWASEVVLEVKKYPPKGQNPAEVIGNWGS